MGWRLKAVGLWMFVLTVTSYAEDSPDEYTMEIRMPNVSVQKPDNLICTAIKLDSSQESNIVKFTPHASQGTVHHMAAVGCLTPGSNEKSWDCGFNPGTSKPKCGSGKNKNLFVWALDAPSLTLPQDVGFRVGGSTKVQYIIVHIHYARKVTDGETDSSGLTIHFTHQRKPKQLGFYTLGNNGRVPPRRKEVHLESSCRYSGKTIYPVAYRTHSHELGVLISAYRIRDGEWTEIGRNSPALPQTFYPVTNYGMEIQQGDILAARCTMNSMSRSDVTRMGNTHHDEMCNFYMIYATDDTESDLPNIYCFAYSPRTMWRTKLSAANFHVPALASSLRGVPNADIVREKFNLEPETSSP